MHLLLICLPTNVGGRNRVSGRRRRRVAHTGAEFSSVSYRADSRYGAFRPTFTVFVGFPRKRRREKVMVESHTFPPRFAPPNRRCPPGEIRVFITYNFGLRVPGYLGRT